MKAFLLAAGVGARLRPLTDHTPKCLVDVNGTPLLGIWFQLLKSGGVDSVLINTHHLADRVRDYARKHAPAGLKVEFAHETTLLGSAGTVRANEKFVRGEKEFLVIYADNLTNLDLADLRRFHHDRRSPFTMGLFRTPSPGECGIAELDGEERVIQFVEKPAHPKSDLANAGLYVCTPAVLDSIPEKPVADFGFDILPLLVGRMFGYRINAFYYDLGTPERLERARRDWPGLPRQEKEKA